MAFAELKEAPEPPKNRNNIGWPLILNALTMLVLYALAATGSDKSNVGLTYFFYLVALLLANVTAAVLAAVLGKPQVAKGFLFSLLGIFLIGLGTCAYLL